VPGVILLLVPYVAAAVFVAAIAHRAVKLARLPLHLRWELYPVAHEKGRTSYGGSYLEEADWWTKPRAVSLAGELKVMIPEIFLLAGVWEYNRSHWVRSFPFHLGLYLSAGLIVLLLVGGAAVAAGVNVASDGSLLARVLYQATYIVGYAGLVLGLIGAAALLGRRLLNPDYREYAKKADYFNLAFFIVAFVVALVSQAAADPQFAGLRAYFAQLVTFGHATAPAAAVFPSSLAPEIVLASVLLAYIPLTHMSHFFTKWFMYHDVRWNDEPNMRGGPIDRKIAVALHYPVTWAAPHIHADGKKTWAQIATEGVEENKK
jgi:nitrate reductase gamma subunit